MTVNFPKNADEASLLSTSQIVASGGSNGSAYRAFFKRAFDTTLIVLSMPIWVPTVLILAILVSLDGSSPFFRQQRVGMNGRIFNMWKLRSMVPNAETLLAKHLAENPAAHREWEVSQKLKSDPRITRLGRIIRKTSLDELPQLVNVLLGEMSLVGPRPMMCSQQELYPGSAYFNLRPGLTGLWQISERNDSEFKSRAIFDNRYDQTVSLRTDVSVLVKTVGVVFKGTGY